MGRGEKKRERPDMELQTAVPATPPVSSDEEEDVKFKNRGRLPVAELIQNGIPKGMRPINSCAFRAMSEPDETEQEEQDTAADRVIKNINYNMLFILAAGVGLGVLLCYKGYDYIAPAMEVATNIVDETVTE
jgi:hypothetical protein